MYDTRIHTPLTHTPTHSQCKKNPPICKPLADQIQPKNNKQI